MNKIIKEPKEPIEIILTFIIGILSGILLSITIDLEYHKTRFKSNEIIIPKIELQIINNKVDTTYVYNIK